MSKTLTNEIAPMVQRQQNARERLIACIQETGQIDRANAEKVATLYLSRECRVAKLNPNDGQFTVLDGRMFETSTIQTASAMIKAGQFKCVK